MPPDAASRRLDVDWLRIFAVYLLFPFHVGKVFDVPPFYHLKNAELSEAMGFFTGFVHQWHMRLLFVLAGWALLASLRARGRSEFLRERFRKLMVPFLAGCFLLCPFMGWAERLNGTMTYPDGRIERLAGPAPGFFEYLPSFFALPGFNWGHLWFLIYLYVFTLLYLPLFRRIEARPGHREHVADGWAWLPLLLLAASEALLRGRWPGVQNLYDDWANFALYSTLFVTGFLLARQPAFEAAVHREGARLGVVGLAAAGLLMSAWAGVVPLPGWARHAASGVAAWGIVAGLLRFGVRHLRRGGAVFRWLRASSFPVYVLHSPAIVLVAFFVVQTAWSIPVKFAVILSGSLALTLLVYEFGVRNLAALRFVFAVPPRRAGPSGTPAESG
jgi:peptidoglycan/LPS O-acetylase OafA/YrhL